MQLETLQRAESALHDYLIWLRDRGDHSDERPGEPEGVSPEGKERRRQKQDGSYTGITESAIQEADRWLRGMDAAWRRHGRLRPDGTLRIVANYQPPLWTPDRLRRVFPELVELDRAAVLIHLDGSIEEEYMSKYQNIREAIDEIVEEHLERHLADKVAGIFTRVLEDMRRERGGAAAAAATVSGRGKRAANPARVCKVCGESGHDGRRHIGDKKLEAAAS